MHCLIYMIVILALASLLVYAVYFRSLVIGLRDNDGFFHLVCAREFHETQRIPTRHEQYFPGRPVNYTYPPALHAFLALLVDRLSLKTILLFPLAATLILAVVVGVNIWVIREDWGEVAVGVLFFLATPSNIKGTVAITPRHLGILFFFLFFALWPVPIMTMLGAAIIHASAMSLSLALLLLSHRMGAQLALICTILLLGYEASIGQTVWAVGCWIVGIALAVIFSGGQYFRVLGDHIKRLKLHFMHGPQSGGGKRLGRLHNILTYNPFVLLAPLLWLPIFGGKINLGSEHLVFVVFTIVGVSFFWIWGSGERHAIFLAPFIPILIVQSGIIDRYPIVLTLALTLAVTLSGIFALRQYRSHLLPKETLEVFEWVRTKSRATTFAVLPRIASPAFVFFSKKRICAYPHDAGAMEYNRLTLRKNLTDPIALASHLREAGVDGLMVQPDAPCTEVIEAMGFVVRFKNSLWSVAERGDIQ